MSNPPEPSAERTRRIRPSLPAVDRHQRGKAHLASVLNHWIMRSGLTTRQLSRIADWGLDHSGWLSDGKISHLRRNAFGREIPTRYLDACGCANEAIWLWQTQGEHAAISRLGPLTKNRVRAEWLDRAIWLAHPDYPTEPLRPADWFDIATGYLNLPCVTSPILAPNEGPQLTDELCRLLLGLVSTESPRDQVRHLVRLYPIADRERRDRFASVLIGATSYDSAEIEAELCGLAGVVAGLRGLTASDYGPIELYEELSRDRRQSGGGATDD